MRALNNMKKQTQNSNSYFSEKMFEMKKIQISAILFCAILIPASLNAQGTVEGEQIDVVKPYQPVLSDAFKISDSPGRDTSVYTVPEMNYGIKSEKASTQYEAAIIKAVKIKDDNIVKLYRSYIKAGFGNYTTPYGEVYINSLRSKNYSAGTHIYHKSSTGTISDVGFPGYSDNRIKLFGTRFFDTSSIDADVNYNRDAFHYYGFKTADTLISKKITEQIINTLDGNFNWVSKNKDKDAIRYKFGVNAYGLQDSYLRQEGAFRFKADANKLLNDLRLGMDLDVDLATMKGTQFEGKSSLVRILPYLAYNEKDINLKGGVKVVSEGGNGSTVFHFYPFVDIDYKLVEDFIVVFGKLDGDVRPNRFRKLLEENRYYSPYSVALNTDNKLSFKAGFRGAFSNAISYSTHIEYKNSNNEYLYVSDTSRTPLNKFSIVYDDINELNIHGELTFRIKKKIRIQTDLDYHNYSPSLYARAYHKPMLELRLAGIYSIEDKINISLGIFHASGIYALDFADGGKERKLDGYVDVNLGLEYRYSKILSLFLNFNNLGASNYERWINYPDQRLNILGGVTYSF